VLVISGQRRGVRNPAELALAMRSRVALTPQLSRARARRPSRALSRARRQLMGGVGARALREAGDALVRDVKLKRAVRLEEILQRLSYAPPRDDLRRVFPRRCGHR
jgi:hypothetical protein